MGRNSDKTSDAAASEKARNPDTEIRVDDEKDTLYNDGLDIGDDSETYADTHANKMPG
jgi:hypothetical protein